FPSFFQEGSLKFYRQIGLDASPVFLANTHSRDRDINSRQFARLGGKAGYKKRAWRISPRSF
ncbi:MAG: hypothetical protein VX438_11420, partial [Planctomycetota bacterium]|nr:hypothetical protein [Planctomycetota bacterium]